MSKVSFQDSISRTHGSNTVGTTKTDITGKSISAARMPMTITESKIAQELTKKEDHCRAYFDRNNHLFIKSRNTILGEDTPRKGQTDVELLVPFKHSMKLNMETLTMEKDCTATFSIGGSTNYMTGSKKVYKRDIDVVDFNKLTAVQSTRNQVEYELEQVKKAVAYRHAMLKGSDHSKVGATAVLATGGLSAPTIRGSQLKAMANGQWTGQLPFNYQG